MVVMTRPFLCKAGHFDSHNAAFGRRLRRVYAVCHADDQPTFAALVQVVRSDVGLMSDFLDREESKVRSHVRVGQLGGAGRGVQGGHVVSIVAGRLPLRVWRASGGRSGTGTAW